LYKVKKDKFYISDPAGGKYALQKNELIKCWASAKQNDGPCPQKVVEMKEQGGESFCGVINLERSMRERIVDLYESSIKAVKQNVVT
jgi:ABC-type bacteriocin/lantibiotic exporter with double-glycine peptidase domain